MHTLSRRHLLGLAGALLAARPLAAETLPKVHVIKDANCPCCEDWIGHIRDAGFPVSFENMDAGALADLKASLGLQPTQVSCHTAQVEGYVIEGHVPADDIKRLLAERLDAIGLAVPGMPYGSPGMGPETEREAFDVLLIAKDGTASTFSSYPAAG
ncbi:MAG: DUF411 domain-containing protein [Tabrizicola sp.]|jgi:hypothetical protein|nr:DUF411 domain-containing protein [Tabrizicola sp.]